MSKLPIVAVFGLSGVGKSWLIGRYAARSAVLHVQASQLLRAAKAAISGAEVTSEELRKGTVLDNQRILIQAFSRFRDSAVLPIIFDGHCVVDNGETLLEIPVDVISELSFSHLIFVEAPAKTIVVRRANDTTRVRPVRSEEEISEHQQRARDVCIKYSEKLTLPLTFVPAGDEEGFANALRGL